MRIEPYLFFNGNAEEAIAFYEKALGAELESKMRYADCPDPVPAEHMPPGGPEKLLHASVLIRGSRIMLSDGVPIDGGGFRGFSLSLPYPTDAETRTAFAALAEGGNVTMPIGATFFSSCFGMLTDRFGVQWMLMTATEETEIKTEN
jgi:PhnB protein